MNKLNPKTCQCLCNSTEEHQAKVIQALESRNAKLMEALESIANNTCCDKCQEAALVAKEALCEENK